MAVGAVNHQTTGATTPGPAIDPKKIEKQKIEKWSKEIKDFLDEGPVGDVTHKDLEKINDIISKVPDDKLDDVIEKLSDEELKTWADEVSSSHLMPIVGGLDIDEQGELFEKLTKNLSGENLAKVYKSYDGTDAQDTFLSEISDADSDKKVGFIGAMAGETITGPDSSININGGTIETQKWDSDARAVAEILGTLDNDAPAFEEALSTLKGEKFDAVMASAVEPRSLTSGMVSVSIFDDKPLSKIIEAAADSNDSKLKARVFKAAAKQLDTMSKSKSAKEDMGEISESLAALIDNDVIKELPDDALTSWTDGVGALDKGEQKEIFNKLAATLNGKDLAKVYSSCGSADMKELFTESVCKKNVKANVKSEFVLTLAQQGQLTDKPESIELKSGTTEIQKWDTDARMVADVLIDLGNEPSALEGTLEKLSVEQLNAITTSAIENVSKTRLHPTGEGVSEYNIFNTDALSGLIDAVAQCSDPSQKSRMFVMAADKLQKMKSTPNTPNDIKKEQGGKIADSLTDLIKTDTVGIMTELERKNVECEVRPGIGISQYMAEMITQGKQEELGEIVADLQGQDPVSFLEDTSANGDLQNASNLGYFIGGFRAGLNKVDLDNKGKANVIKTIFSAAIAVAATRMPAVGGAIASQGATYLTNSKVDKEFKLVLNGKDPGAAFENLAVPREVKHNEAENCITSTITRIKDNNQELSEFIDP